MWFVVQGLFLAFPKRRPRPDGHIRNTEHVTRDKFVVCKLAVEHTIKPPRFRPIAIFCISNVFGGVFQEVMALTRHWPNPTHLPMQPLVDSDTVGFPPAIKETSLSGQILKDRAAFENRDWRAIRAVWIHDGRHPVVRGDFQEFRIELAPFADVYDAKRVR